MTSLFTRAEAEAARKAEAEAAAKAATAPDAFADAIRSLDLARCRTVEFIVPLLDEFEAQGVTHYLSTWPPAVVAKVRREAERFLADHGGIAIRCITSCVGERVGRARCCVLILHYLDQATNAAEWRAAGIPPGGELIV
jgi:hypothetical protein